MSPAESLARAWSEAADKCDMATVVSAWLDLGHNIHHQLEHHIEGQIAYVTAVEALLTVLRLETDAVRSPEVPVQ